MIGVMTRVKIAVSLPEEQVLAAREAVLEGRAPSVSAYVSEALDERHRHDGVRHYIDLLIEKYGAPSAEDYAWADEQLARVDELDARGGYESR
jgi:Arc/MetJ-type ribon-helix-helix transcriptional regulator